MSFATGHKTPDPGPPTWIEAADGFAALKRAAGEKVRDTADILRDYPLPLRLEDPPTPERAKAASAFSAADAEWKHWNAYQQRYDAFMRVHPNMRDVRIDAPCEHKGACWVGPDDGWYALPGGKAAGVESPLDRVNAIQTHQHEESVNRTAQACIASQRTAAECAAILKEMR